MVEEVEHPIPTKCLIRHMQNLASDGQVQLLAFLWWNFLEQKGEW